MRSSLTGLLAASVLVLCPLVAGERPVTPPAAGLPAPVDHDASPAALAAGTPRTRLLWNDPRRRTHVVSEAIVANVDAVPPGESIDVSTYWISSRPIAAALRRAALRGVAVHVLLAGNDKARRFGTSRRLLRFLNRPGAGDSWGMWSAGAARGRGGLMHQKSYRFSRVGTARWVVMNGSYNSAATSDQATYALMWQVVGDRALYDAFAAVGRQQVAQRNLPHPLRRYAGPGWSAYFLPGAARPRRDPVMARLGAIPADRRTRITIEMYSMWGARAFWIARRLAAMSRAGARIALVAGPTVDTRVQGLLRDAGVRVLPGCFADRTYIHAKDMAATWMSRGRRVHWTWVGSDNWTSAGMDDDEAVLGVAGAEGYRTFRAAFRAVARRTDGVATRDCRPRLD